MTDHTKRLPGTFKGPPPSDRVLRSAAAQDINNSNDDEVNGTVTMIVERKVRLVTEQHNIDKPSPMADFPMKEWSVKIYVLDQDGNEHPASCFIKATYNLHPSFEDPHQSFSEPPFTCRNEGWGEFEMSIDLYITEKTKSTVFHDLNFQSASYGVEQSVSFKNPSQTLLNILRETGPIVADEPKGRRVANDAKKRKAAYDYEQIADALSTLDEDELLHVVQMIHDNKQEDTNCKNDIANGEFAVDLYTMGEPLSKMLWEFLVQEGKIPANP